MITAILKAFTESPFFSIFVVWAAIVLFGSLIIAFAMRAEHGLGQHRYTDTSRPLPTFNPFEVVEHHFLGRWRNAENRVVYRIKDVGDKTADFDQHMAREAERASERTAEYVHLLVDKVRGRK